jgi:hypothetical protein
VAEFWNPAGGQGASNPVSGSADERSVGVRLRHQLSSTCLDALGLLRA